MPAPLSAQYPFAIGAFVGGSATVGSLLYVGAGTLVAQDNTNLFYDETNKRLGIGTASPSMFLDVRGNGVNDVARLVNTNASGYSALQFATNANVNTGYLGYANASAGDTTVAGKHYWRSISTDTVFTYGASTPSTLALHINGTNGRVGIGAAANVALGISYNQTAAPLVQLKNLSSSGYAAIDFINSAGSGVAGYGYANASVATAAFQNRVYLDLQSGVDYVITGAGTPRLTVRQTGDFIVGASQTLTKPVNGNFTHEFTRDGAAINVVVSAYGTTAVPSWYTYRGRGTAASTTAVLSGDVLGNWVWVGAIGSGDTATAGALLRAVTTENWAGNNCGSRFELHNIPNGSGAGGRVQRLAIEHDGAWVMTNSASAGNSLASEVRLRNSSNKLQASFNAGGYFDVGTYAAALTTGSIPFANGSNQLAQDNAAFFWDATQKRMLITLTAADPADGKGAVTLRNTNAGGNASVYYNNAAGSFVGADGYDNATNLVRTFTATGVSYAIYTNQAGFQWIFSSDGAIQAPSGGAAAVSGANTGRLRYNTTGQVFQTSLNGASYFNLPQLAAALSTGSVVFADSSGRLAQDNATFFWDNTNKVLGIGLTTPDAGRRAHLRSSGSGAALSLDTSNAAGVGGCVFADNGTVHGGMGYTTSGGSQVANRLRAAFQGIDVDAVITVGSGVSSRVAVLASVSSVAVGVHNTNPGFALDVGDSAVTTNAIALRAGSTASVSAASTGNFRFNESTNKFQVSLNGAAYVDIATSDLYVPQSRTLTAGAGLTGGGDLSANRTFDVGAGTGITVNADDVAVNQGFAFAWTGAHTWDLGTSPGDAISFLMTAPGVAGQRDSHRFVVRGASFDTGAHTTDWRQYVDITSNAGASKYVWESRIDAGSFTGRAYLDDAGTFSTSTVLASGTSGGTNILATNAFTGQTNGFPVISGRATGSYDTTATFLLVAGVWGEFAGSRSAGANDLAGIGVNGVASGAQQNVGVNGQANGTADINYGLAGTAYGGTINYALFTDQGDVLLNNTSGITTIQGATTVNNKITQKAHSNFSGSGSVQTTAAIQTTDATQTTLFSLTLPDTSDTWISVEVVARDTAGTERAIYGKIALVYREGGGATIQGSVQDIHSDVETSAGLDATITVSSNDVRVSVTGLAATTINWAATINYQTVSGSA